MKIRARTSEQGINNDDGKSFRMADFLTFDRGTHTEMCICWNLIT
jgi:hypothetical protein